jgi:membrane fusion protein (multidrug efflux system)
MSSAVVTKEVVEDVPKVPAKPARKPLSPRRLALVGTALAVLAGGSWYGQSWWTTGRFIESTDDAYVGGNITAISPHVGGFIAEVLVTDNQPVKAGQVLVRLDPRDFQAALDHAAALVDARLASLTALRANYVLQQSTIRQQEADVSAKAAQLTFATQDASRYHSLAQTSAGSIQDAQRAASLEQQAKSSLLAGAATLEAARQQLKVLEAQIAEPTPAWRKSDPTWRPLDSTSATRKFGHRSMATSATGQPRWEHS